VPFAFASARAVDGIDPGFSDRPLSPKPMNEAQVRRWLDGIVSARLPSLACVDLPRIDDRSRAHKPLRRPGMTKISRYVTPRRSFAALEF